MRRYTGKNNSHKSHKKHILRINREVAVKPKLALCGIVVAAMAFPLFAHHSFSAEYDESKPVSVTGVVRKVEWQNPHIWFYVDVKDQAGKVTTWGFSGGPPGMLQRRGITRDVLKVGDVIKVTGFRAKDGSNNASGGNVAFADGRQVFAGAAEDVVPKQ
jgi:hypothetical protein